MRGEYFGQRGARPRNVCRTDHGEVVSAHLCACAGCRSQVLICKLLRPRPRRGPRQLSLRAAGRRYQTSHRGHCTKGTPQQADLSLIAAVRGRVSGNRGATESRRRGSLMSDDSDA
jgi:hypothetical protein